MVTTNRFGRVGIIRLNHDGGETSIDHSLYLLIRPDGAFHDSTGNAPLARKEYDNGFSGLGRLLLRRGEVFGPSDLVGGDVEVEPYPDEGDRDGAEPEPAPKVELAPMGLGCDVSRRR